MTQKKKKIISNIAFILALVLIYGFALFAIITRFTGGALYLGKNRVDVILTDSMSTKDEHHLDFLEGTYQIQPFDMVVSERIDENTALKVKDVVMFKNPNMGNKLVVHRIINITEEGIEFGVNNYISLDFDYSEAATKLKEAVPNVAALSFISPTAGVVQMATLDYTAVKVVGYSLSSTSYIDIYSGPNKLTDTTVETDYIASGVYRHTVSYTRTSSAPNKLYIRSGTDQKEFISSVTYTSKSKGNYVFNASELPKEAVNNYSKLFDPYYLYEIRADKSATADGIYERSALIAKTNIVIPKLGWVVHFIQSIPGLITLIGLALIITLASFFWTKNEKTKKAVAASSTEVVEDTSPSENIEDNKQEIEKSKEDAKVDKEE